MGYKQGAPELGDSLAQGTWWDGLVSPDTVTSLETKMALRIQ